MPDNKKISAQSRLTSLLETTASTAIGFGVTVCVSPFVYPLFGHTFSYAQNVGLAAFFTLISVVRAYVVRRWFEARIRRAAVSVLEGGGV